MSLSYEVLHREFICPHVPTAMCHGSTLLVLPNGQILAAWFGGSREGNADTAIWLSRRERLEAPTACGAWSAPFSLPQVPDCPPEAHWNPVLRRDLRGDVVLYYKRGQQIATWRSYTTRSTDNGQSWSAACELLAGDRGGRGPVRNKLLRLASGRLLAPASLEQGAWTAFADISDDDGHSWHTSSPISISPEYLRTAPQPAVAPNLCDIPVSEQSFTGRGVIQPSIWEDAHGVHMLLRSTEGSIFRSDSVDQGESWTHATPTAMPNNNSALDLAQLDSGALALVCNPVPANWGGRTPLTLFISTDKGTSWTKLLDLDSGTGEFAYPAIVAEGNTLHISYTWKRMTVAYWRIACEL